jgi:hypothetical protein
LKTHRMRRPERTQEGGTRTVIPNGRHWSRTGASASQTVASGGPDGSVAAPRAGRSIDLQIQHA